MKTWGFPNSKVGKAKVTKTWDSSLPTVTVCDTGLTYACTSTGMPTWASGASWDSPRASGMLLGSLRRHWMCSHRCCKILKTSCWNAQVNGQLISWCTISRIERSCCKISKICCWNVQVNGQPISCGVISRIDREKLLQNFKKQRNFEKQLLKCSGQWSANQLMRNFENR